MDVKKDILWRVYLSFIALVVFGFMVMAKVVQLQFVDGDKWRNMGDSLYKSQEILQPERGTIYSEDMEMLSSSIPFFDVHIDFRTDGLRAKNGKLFYSNVDSMSFHLANLFKDKTKQEYKTILTKAYKLKEPYFELKTKLSYQQYFQLRKFPLVKLGSYKSGFVVDVKDVRLNPFGLMANRTIGLSRGNTSNVGLEKYYDSVLKGQSGSRLVQFIAGGARVPINGSEIEPVNGKDIVTTLNIQMQDIAQNALLKMMQQNEALTGTAIVMEVSTGK
jgi:cell division protein FtsI (penicillin-binding protein 3)